MTSAQSDEVKKATSLVALPVSAICRAARTEQTLPRCVAKPTPKASGLIMRTAKAELMASGPLLEDQRPIIIAKSLFRSSPT